MLVKTLPPIQSWFDIIHHNLTTILQPLQIESYNIMLQIKIVFLTSIEPTENMHFLIDLVTTHAHSWNDRDGGYWDDSSEDWFGAFWADEKLV